MDTAAEGPRLALNSDVQHDNVANQTASRMRHAYSGGGQVRYPIKQANFGDLAWISQLTYITVFLPLTDKNLNTVLPCHFPSTQPDIITILPLVPLRKMNLKIDGLALVVLVASTAPWVTGTQAKCNADK